METRRWSIAHSQGQRAVGRRRVWRELVGLGRTAIPIAAVGFVNLAMTITDTLMMAHLDPRALAAGAIVGDLYSVVIQFCAGALGAVAAPVAAACAVRAEADAGRTIAEGMRWAVILGIGGALLIAFAPYGLRLLGVALPLPDVAATYALYMAGALVLMMVVALSRSVLPAAGLGRLPLYVMAAAVPLNAFADAAFMYGWLGLPAMGLVGAGAASLVVAAGMAGILLACLIFAPAMRSFQVARGLLAARMTGALAKAGAMTGAVALCETGVYLSSTAVVGFFAINAVPAHVAVFRSVAMTYVLGTGFAQAITIHAARGIALSGRLHDLVRAAHLLVLILGPAFFAFLMVAPNLIGAAMEVDGSEIRALTPWAGLAVCSLVPTVVAFGFLRARVDVVVPAVISLIGYWGVGFTTMIVLAGPAGLGVKGIWIGLAVGTGATALASWTYLKRQERGGRSDLPGGLAPSHG